MNAVELDVGNLNQWFLANPGLVDFSARTGTGVFIRIVAACLPIQMLETSLSANTA
jgi:hypothetical protein